MEVGTDLSMNTECDREDLSLHSVSATARCLRALRSRLAISDSDVTFSVCKMSVFPVQFSCLLNEYCKVKTTDELCNSKKHIVLRNKFDLNPYW